MSLCACHTQKPRNDREVHGSRTGTDEYFIVRSRNGVITFLWFLFLPLHVSAVIVHAPLFVICRFRTQYTSLLLLLRSILSLHSHERNIRRKRRDTRWMVANFRNLVPVRPRFRFFSMGDGEELRGCRGGRLKGDDGRTFRMHGRKVSAKLFDRNSTVCGGGGILGAIWRVER